MLGEGVGGGYWERRLGRIQENGATYPARNEETKAGADRRLGEDSVEETGEEGCGKRDS